MLHISKNNIITMTVGDEVYFYFYIKANKNNDIYLLNSKDKVYFYIMEANASYDEAVVTKTLDYNNIIKDTPLIKISLDENDTKLLQSGNYYYQIKLERYINPENYKTETIMNKRRFILTD